MINRIAWSSKICLQETPPFKYNSSLVRKTASWRLVTASPHLGAIKRTAASAGLGNMALKELQARLDALIKMPSNLPIIYLLGDTGAGKTCIVRQLLGTKNQSFPSVRRLRTTVAPTDFIITIEPE